MSPAARFKFGLLTIGALLGIAFLFNAAQGQIRPPRPGGIRPPSMVPPRMPGGGINPPGGRITTVWTCPKCGYRYEGAVPPSVCPGCQTRMTNGVGNGIPGPGGRGGVNPGRPFTPPTAGPIPPAANPPPPGFNGGQPVTGVPVGMNPPPANPAIPNPVDSSTASSGDSSSPSSAPSAGARNWTVIVLVIGIIIVGVFVLLGGTWLMIYTMRSSNTGSRRRRRRRRDEDDYEPY